MFRDMLEVRPFSAVRDCLFNTFAAALHVGGRSLLNHWKGKKQGGVRKAVRTYSRCRLDTQAKIVVQQTLVLRD
jgi:hypothetical protein